VSEGGLQLAGIRIITTPSKMPPNAAVYVKSSVFPVEFAAADWRSEVIVPDPSGASTWTTGELATGVKVPPLVDMVSAVNVAGPGVVGASTPGPGRSP